MESGKLHSGFTLVELLLVMGISMLLMGFITINLVTALHNTSVSASADRLIADLKSQQTNAMNGASESMASGDSYGIYIGTNTYVLFHGIIYNPFDPDNFPVNSDGTVSYSTTFPLSVIIFSQGSGEIMDYSDAANTITVKNVSGNEQQTIRLNKYGVVVN